MKYKNIRNKHRLDTYTVSKLLGINEKTYVEIEKGYRNLEGNLIDKFMDIMDNAKAIRLNNAQLERDIDEWINSGEALKDIKDSGYSQSKLANKLNITPSVICKMLKGKNSSFNTKCKVYDFIKNPLNKNIEYLLKKEKEKNVKDEEEITDENLAKEVKNTKKDVIEEKETTENPTDLINDILELKEENDKLKKQIERYEKLIDRLD